MQIEYYLPAVACKQTNCHEVIRKATLSPQQVRENRNESNYFPAVKITEGKKSVPAAILFNFIKLNVFQRVPVNPLLVVCCNSVQGVMFQKWLREKKYQMT